MGSLVTDNRSIINAKNHHVSFSGADVTVYATLSSGFNINSTLEKSTEPLVINNVVSNPFASDTEYYSEDYSPTQITASETIKTTSKEVSLGEGFIKLVELQTISYSVYRGKEGARGLGNPNVRGYTRGYRTVAGSMIFTVFGEAVFTPLFKLIQENVGPFSKADALPPLDLFIFFTNELGQASHMAIWGVDFINEGQVMSIQDLMTENAMNYVAMEVSPMRPVGKELIKSFNAGLIYDADLREARNEYNVARGRVY